MEIYCNDTEIYEMAPIISVIIIDSERKSKEEWCVADEMS